MIVLASVGVVIVGEFFEIVDPFVRLLQNGNADGHIIGSLEVLSIIVLEVFLLDVHEELSIKGTKVAGHKWIFSVGVALDDRGWKGT